MGIRVAPEYVVDDLLWAEGFSNIRHVSFPAGTYTPDGIAHGAVDFGLNFPSLQVAGIHRGVSMKALAGVHVGCFELIMREGICGVADLPGTRSGSRRRPNCRPKAARSHRPRGADMRPDARLATASATQLLRPG
ncbi:MAG TPA: hypothetical protein VE687_05315, partial [Stellaceae bacterium]|nr:hypothetical protein [Stellaceae bacterium]